MPPPPPRAPKSGNISSRYSTVTYVITAQQTGQSRADTFISMEEVARHNKPDDAWIVLHGRVYDITNYIPKHPGGIIRLQSSNLWLKAG